MTLDEILPKLLDWLVATAGSTNNVWCTLGFEKQTTSANIREYFDRKDLNEKFVLRYGEQDLNRKQDHLTYGAEIAYIYGFSKAFAARHRTRLQLFADDWANKKIRVPQAINYGYGSFKHMRRSGEAIFNAKSS